MLAAMLAPEPGARPHTTQTPLAGLVFVFTWLWLNLRTDAPIHHDTSRDLAMARDIVEGATHPHVGVPSAMLFEQGTTWLDFLALCGHAGLGAAGIEHVLTTLLAAAVMLVYLGLARALPSRDEPALDCGPPLIGAAVTLALVPLVIEVPILWQPSLLPVPVVLAHLSLWRLLERGELKHALALTIFAALAFDVHVVAVVLVVVVAGVVPLTSERPVLASVAAPVLGVATLSLRSRDLLPVNLRILSEQGWLWATLAGVVVVVVVGAGCRRAFAALDFRRKFMIVLIIELTMTVLVALVGLTLDASPDMSGRYLAPCFPAVGAAAALALSGLHSRRGLALAAVLAGLSLLLSFGRLHPRNDHELPLTPAWTIADFDPIAATIVERGHSWTELVGRIQGPGAWQLLAHLATVVDRGSPTPEAPDPRVGGLLIIALEAGDAERVQAELPGEQVRSFELERGRALLVQTPARLQRTGAQLCVEHDECEHVQLITTRRSFQAYPSAWIDGGLAVWRAGELLRWRLPVAAGPTTVAVASTDRLPERCAWRFVSTEGFESPTALPAPTLELPADATGAVTIARPLMPDDGACDAYVYMPPAIVETQPEWVALRELLESSPSP